MKTPSQHLPACPVCSSVVAIFRPMWRYARHTSAAHGRNCYMLVGCSHSAEVCDPSKIRDDPAEWDLIQQAWKDRAEQLFAARTVGWSAHASDGLRRALSDTVELPGMTASLALDEPEPSSAAPTSDDDRGF